MITKKQIRVCKAEAKKNGFQVGDTDIAYITMCKTFEDKQMAYTLLFRSGQEMSQEEYDASDKMIYLRDYINDLIKSNKAKRGLPADANSISEAISFEENREGMELLLTRIKELYASGEIDADKAIKLEMDARAKLNDKFNIKENNVEQRIIVQPKFNHICDYTQKECWLQTKEYAKEHWHLIDDPNYK